MSKECDHVYFSRDNLSNLRGGEEKSCKKLPDTKNLNRQIESDMEATTPPTTWKKRRALVGKGGRDQMNQGKGGGDLDHDMHIRTERERRKKMRDMFANLQAFLPQLPPKADKSTIVEEAVNHITTLEKTLEKLEELKLEKLHGIITPVNSLPGMMTTQNLLTQSREAFLADQGSSKNNLPAIAANSFSFSQIPAIFQTWTSPNVSLNICGQDANISICCPKKAGLLSAICYVLEKHKLEVVSAQFSSDHHRSTYMIQARATGVSNRVQEDFPVEEIYKQAAGEIMFYVNS